MGKHGVRRMLEDNPSWIDVIHEGLKSEERFTERAQGYPDARWLGFEWHEVHAQPQTLNKMVSNHVLDVGYKSRSATHYTIPDIVRQAIADIDLGEPDSDPVGVDEKMFSPIIGYDDIKDILIMALRGEKRVHFLLEGDPATAKSLFMICIQQAVPSAYYITGSRATPAGVTDALLSNQPKVLLFDEIEKCDLQTYSVLLSLMESGLVVETKHKRHVSATMSTVVIGSCNRSQKLPPELISRFDFHLKMKGYDRDGFLQVCRDYLATFEGMQIKLAEYLAGRIWDSKSIPSDIRKARGIARILTPDFTKGGIDKMVDIEEKYGG